MMKTGDLLVLKHKYITTGSRYVIVCSVYAPVHMAEWPSPRAVHAFGNVLYAECFFTDGMRNIDLSYYEVV